MSNILVFSQDSNLQTSLKNLLESNAYEVFLFSDSYKAINSLHEQAYDLVLIDFPPDSTFNHELITSIHCFQDMLPIIAIIDNSDLSIAREAIKNGAANYVSRPLNPNALLLTLEITLKQADTLIENLLYKCNFQRTEDYNFVITSSEYMLKVYSLIEKIAKTDLAVLLTGEAGSGKETIARRIHDKSQRNKYKFCKVDCAAIPLEMQESEFFGYVRNVPTQEARAIAGIFEKNNGGTIFLDNINALPMNTQIKLLYLLQHKKIQLIGGSKIINIDIRLIAGSDIALHDKAARGGFCEDLYKKLSIATIHLPALRERREDIPEIVEHFLDYFANENSKDVKINSHALTILCEYDWPGNIEQLKTLIEKLVAANETGLISSEELPDELFQKTPVKAGWDKIINDKLDDIVPLKKYLQNQELTYMQKVLEHSGGDKNLAAKKLGISLASFYRKLQ